MNRYTPGISLFAAGILVFAVTVSTAEAQVTAVLTGDNHYYLFLGGIAPPFPGPQDCGPDRTDDPLTCNTSCP